MSPVRRAARLGLWAGSLLLVPTAATSAEATRPNVVVIVVDDLRFDEFGAGGHP